MFLIVGPENSKIKVIFIDYGNFGLAEPEALLELNDKTLLSFAPLVW